MDSLTSKSFIPLWPWGQTRGVSEFLELEKAIDACYFNFPLNVVSPLEISCLPISPWLSPECSCSFLGKAAWFIFEQLWFLDILAPFSLQWKEKIILGVSLSFKPFKGFLWPLESSPCSQQLCMFIPPSTSRPHPSSYPTGKERNSRHWRLFSLPSISLFHSHLQPSYL